MSAKVGFPGETYGDLTILSEAEPRTYPSGSTHRYVTCRCQCGAKADVAVSALRTGHTQSCGCKGGVSRASGRRRVAVGDRFGWLTVLDREGLRARCLCQCGTVTTFEANNLRRGITTSCGCKVRKHGHSTQAEGRTPTYISWMSMRARCGNPKHRDWKHYGGRGITVCDRWRDNFEAFLADMGERPQGRTLDRIDNAGNYEPANCRWATAVEQRHNRRDTVAA